MNPVILTPVYRYFEPEYLDSCEKTGVAKLRQRGSACIHEARDLLVYQAIQAGFDILLFIDSDIAFEPADVDKVLKMCDETKGVVVGTYCSKAPPHAPIGFVVKDGIYAGMGFTAIHKEALLKMAPIAPLAMLAIAPVYTNCYFFPLIVDNACLPEDYAFCYRALQSGVRVIRHPEVVVQHVGFKAYTPV